MMHYKLATLLSFTSLVTLAVGQFVKTPTDLKTKMGAAGVQVRYKKVPNGICETRANVTSLSGYVDVGQDQHMYFQFYESRKVDPKKAPLTIWINGGPGSSSMIGLWQELGSCSINSDGEVVDNPHAWNEESNMIFIDQPITTGFSYSKAVPAYTSNSGSIVVLPSNECPDYAQRYGTCGTYSYDNTTLTAKTTQGAAPNFYKALQGFMGAFPQYTNAGVNFATESYGGHYGPTFVAYILEQNKKAKAGHKHVDLRSLAIGNGWFDPLLQYQAYLEYMLDNPYDLRYQNQSIVDEITNALYGKGNCLDRLKDCRRTGDDLTCSTADTFCATEVESPFDDYFGRDEYDVRELTPSPFPYNHYVEFLNTPKVQEALGLYTNFSESSSTTSAAYASTGDDGRESYTIENLRSILAAGVTVAIYVGDADYNCGIKGQDAIIKEISVPGFSSAGFTNLTTSDGVVHGQTKQLGTFSYTRFFYSGHEVPFYQPLASLEFFNRVIHGKDVATGKHSIKHGSTYKTLGTKLSTFHEGNSTVQDSVLPDDATYNTTTGAPNPSAPSDATEEVAPEMRRKQLRFMRRGLKQARDLRKARGQAQRRRS